MGPVKQLCGREEQRYGLAWDALLDLARKHQRIPALRGLPPCHYFSLSKGFAAQWRAQHHFYEFTELYRPNAATNLAHIVFYPRSVLPHLLFRSSLP